MANILMLLESKFPPDQRVENEILSLLDAGHSITLACKGSKQEVINWHGARIIRKPMPKFIYKSSIGCLSFFPYFSWWWRFVKSILEDNKFDVIHIHDLPLAIIGIEARRDYVLKFVLDLHENYPALLDSSQHTKIFLGRLFFSLKQWKRYEAGVVKSADEVITICKESAERLQQFRSSIWVVQNTVNLKTIQRRTKLLTPNELTLVYMGGVTRHRGLQDIIQAMHILKTQERDIQLVVIGEGKYIAQLKNLAMTLGVTDRIKFTGYKTFTSDLMLRCHVGIIPHQRTENNIASSPNKLFHYMYYGLPVITSSCESLVRIVRESQCGWTYSTIMELVDLIKTLDDDREWLNYMGERGHKAVMDKYNWGVDALSLLNLYQHLNERNT
jgi:glycosyltransferase involved in cell wall biosynthesis